MSIMVKVEDPKGKTHIVSVPNANDLVQHLGWKRIKLVNVKDGVNNFPDAQEVLDKKVKPAAPEADELDAEDEVPVSKGKAVKAADLPEPDFEKPEDISERELAELNSKE